jgi:hypothetical protein
MKGKQMKLYPIYVTGIKAYCSDLVVEPDSRDFIYFISIAGYQATVKGIIANLLESCRARVYIEDQDYDLSRTGYEYKVLTKKMPSGLVHSLLYPRLAIPAYDEKNQSAFFLFTEQHQDVYSLFFKHLDDKTHIPLHPSWDRWLWEVFEKEGWITELFTLLGLYKGYFISFDADQLADLISEAIQEQESKVIACMQFNGGNKDGQRNFA